MQDEPHPPEILQAVATFLRDIVVQATDGAVAYQARVAAAALDLVRREILRAAEDDAERARLRDLLGRDGTLPELNAELAQRLANGVLDLSSPGVAAHLWATTREKLAVDQPRYRGLHSARKDDAS